MIWFVSSFISACIWQLAFLACIQAAKQTENNGTTVISAIDLAIELPAGLIAAIGIIANVINMIILSRPLMASSTNVYLLAVSVYDFIHLVLTTLYVFHKKTNLWIYRMSVVYLRSTANLTSNATTWLTLTFTIERLVVVTKPMFGKRICTQTKARIAVVVVTLAAFIFTFPDYLEKKIIHTSQGTYNLTETVLTPFFTKIYYYELNQFLFVILPLILLIICNSLLIRSVLKATENRKFLTRGQHSYGLQKGGALMTRGTVPSIAIRTKDGQPSHLAKPVIQKKPILNEQQKITVMLILVVMAFLILQTPSCIVILRYAARGAETNTSLNSTDPHKESVRLKWQLFSRISNTLLQLSAALNFVFYSLFSIKFRKTFKAIFTTPIVSKIRQFRNNSRLKSQCCFKPDNSERNDTDDSHNNRIIPLTHSENLKRDFRKSPLSRKSNRAGRRLADSYSKTHT